VDGMMDVFLKENFFHLVSGHKKARTLKFWRAEGAGH